MYYFLVSNSLAYLFTCSLTRTQVNHIVGSVTHGNKQDFKRTTPFLISRQPAHWPSSAWYILVVIRYILYSLTCLPTCLLTYSLKSKKCQEMVVANKENIKTNYPFAIVCVNLTLLLIDALSVRDSKYLSVQGMLSLTFSLTHSLIRLRLRSRILGDVRGPECILWNVLLLFSAGGCIMARS